MSHQGKSKVSKNALRHGYYCETFRDYRKSKRSKQIILLEKECLSLIRAVERKQFDKVEELVEKLKNLYLEICGLMDCNKSDAGMVVEIYYATALQDRTFRYSLNRILKYQNMNLNGKENEK